MLGALAGLLLLAVAVGIFTQLGTLGLGLAPEPVLPLLTVHTAAAPRTPATAERAPPRS